MLAWRRPPTHRLLLARFSADLKQLFDSAQFNQVGKGVDTLGGLPPPQAPPEGSPSLHLASPADVKAHFGFGKCVQRSAPTITQTKSERDVVAVARFSNLNLL